MNRIALADEIASAFRRIGRDPEQSLHQAQLTDQGMSRRISDSEWRAAGRLDRESEWTEVPQAALDKCDAALSHFTPVNWRFYLPAYLCRALSLFTEPAYESKLLRSVVFHLTLPSDSLLAGYLRERYELLDTPQRLAVRHFLEYVERQALHLVESTNGYWPLYDDARRALESYWRP